MRRRPAKIPNHTEERVPWASFADALTGLLFVFILLSLSFAHQLQEAKEEQVDARKKADAEFEEARRKVDQARRAHQVAQELVGMSSASANSEYSVARCLEDTIGSSADTRVQPSPTLYEARLSLYLYDQADESRVTIEWFHSGEATLGRGPCRVARSIGPCLAIALKHPELATPDEEFQLRVFVEGHTDAVPITNGHSAIPTNWELSGARAAAVVRAFLVPPGKNGQAISCTADPNGASVLKQHIAKGDLDVVSVGLADRRPAWKRMCDELKSDPVCRCLEGEGGAPEKCTDTLKADARVHHGQPDDLPADQLISWANRPTEADDDQRRRLQRRVDLRFEVTPRDPTRILSTP